MYIRTQDEKAIVPCHAIDSCYNEKFKKYEIYSINPKEIFQVPEPQCRLIGVYVSKDQYYEVMRDLEDALVRTGAYYRMPLECNRL